MNASIITEYPGQQFWDAFAGLQANSAQPSVFQGRHFIQYLAKKFEGSLAIYVCYKNDQMMGVAFFYNDGGIYKLLSGVKSDYNFITIHKECTETEVSMFFKKFFPVFDTGTPKIKIRINRRDFSAPSWCKSFWIPIRQIHLR